ncbi:MAG: transposase [Catenulisporales bacterium]|nr:transposase [Catenulisporales bacterium]
MSDAQGARIEPLLPDRSPRRGGRWRDRREVIDAVAWKYRTGLPWTDMPEQFGSWKGMYTRISSGAGSPPDTTRARRSTLPRSMSQASSSGRTDDPREMP